MASEWKEQEGRWRAPATDQRVEQSGDRKREAAGGLGGEAITLKRRKGSAACCFRGRNMALVEASLMNTTVWSC